jgi:replication initiation and membrane attachment protein DnaB
MMHGLKNFKFLRQVYSDEQDMTIFGIIKPLDTELYLENKCLINFIVVVVGARLVHWIVILLTCQ